MAAFLVASAVIRWSRRRIRYLIMPICRSPIARTLGSQFVWRSTALVLMLCICLTASRPMAVMATSRKAMTVVIFVRMEILENMTGSLGLLTRWLAGSETRSHVESDSFFQQISIRDSNFRDAG